MPHILSYKAITKECFFKHYRFEAVETGSLVFQLSDETLTAALFVDDVRHCSITENTEPFLCNGYTISNSVS